MNNEQFWSILQAETSTFQERVDLIRTCEYDLHEESQPWCITRYFEDLVHSETPIEDAFKVAEVMKERLGLLVVEKESSYCLNKYVTIMDEFDFYVNKDPTFCVVMLRHAFKKTGFLYAKDADPRVLYRAYSNKYYGTFEDSPFADMFEPCPFAEELAQYIFHPNRVANWLEQNPDKGVDEYMN